MADVAVVGAGVAGASVAFALARRGARVTIVDDARPGRATAAGAGIIAPWATALTGEVYDLYAAGAEAYPAVLAALGDVGVGDVGYTRNGALVVASDDEADEQLATVTRRAARSTVAGAPERVDAAAAAALFPPLRCGLHGVFVPGGARVDGRRLVAGLLDGVRRHGGSVRIGTAAVQGRTVVVDGERIVADHVVIAAGAWIGDVLLDRASPVAPQRGQICHLLVDESDTGRWPSILPPTDHYIVPFEDGRVVVGATRETGVGEVRVTAAGVSHVLSRALDLAPGLAGASLLETRVGLRPFPVDGHRPTIGPIDDDTWVVTGFGAVGLTIGPTVGDRVADMMLDRTNDELLSPFAPT